MNLTCPHCATALELDAEILATLQDRDDCDCPSCGGLVPLPNASARRAVAPLRDDAGMVDPATGQAPAAADPARRTHSKRIHRNLLVLGTATLLVLGGLVFVLANRNPGEIRSTERKIVNKRELNDYFRRIIQNGTTTEQALNGIGAIESFGDSYIGLTAEALSWQDAEALARRAGGSILELAPSGTARQELAGWLEKSHPSTLGKTTWITEDGKPTVVDSPDSGPVTNPERPRHAFVFWPGNLITGWAWSIEPRFDEVMPFDGDGFATVRVGDEWRRIDKSDADVGVPSLKLPRAFTNSGFAGIQQGNKVGLIDQNRKVLAKPEWDDIQEHINGFTPVKRDGKWGYLDAEGNQAVPCEWDDAWRFSPEGYAVVTRDGKRGIIDRSGKPMIQPQWEGVLNFCKEGIGAVRGTKAGLWGLVDTSGKQLCEPLYEMRWQDRRFDLGFIRLRLPGQVDYIYLGMDGKPVDTAAAEGRAAATRPPILPENSPAGKIPFDILRTNATPAMRQGLRLAAAGDLGGFLNRRGESGKTNSLINALGQVVMPDVNPDADFQSDFIPYATPPKFGLMKADGSVLVSPRWDEVRILSQDWVRFRVGRKYGLADGNGKVVVEPRWDEVEVLMVDSGSLADDGKRILLGRDGKLILSPWIRAKDGDKTVILRKNGEPALPDTLVGAEYVDFYGPEQVVITEPGLAGLRLWSLYEPASGHKTTFPTARTMRWNWSTALVGQVWVQDRTSGWHLMDQTGKDLGYTKNEDPLGWEVRDGCGLLHDANGPFFINAKGRRLGTGIWQAAREFSEQRVAVQRDGKWGFIDTEGGIVCDPMWEEVTDFHHGLARVRAANRWGFIDLKGATLVEPKWEEVREFQNGLAAVKANGFWGYVDLNGKTTVEPVWDATGDYQVLCKPLPPGEVPTGPLVARVSIGGASACIDATGTLVAEPKYNWIQAENDLLVAGTNAGTRDVIRISSDGKPVITTGKSQAGRYVESFDVAADRMWLLRPKGEPRRGSDWALCDETGRPLTPYRWGRPWRKTKLDALSRGAILARSHLQAYGLLRYDGTELLPAKFDPIIWVAPGVAEVWSATEGGLFDTDGKWRFKDNDKVRIARFEPRVVPRPLVDEPHDLIVIEDTPKWGYAKLISGPSPVVQK